MSVAKNLIGPLAQTNHFLVTFSSLTPAVEEYLNGYSGISDIRPFLSRTAGILCNSATLPTTAYATADIRDNFMGVPQQFAHTRIYTDIDFQFYIDDIKVPVHPSKFQFFEIHVSLTIQRFLLIHSSK